MEKRYGYRGGLSDADIAAFEYQADLLDRTGEFRLGQYEPAHTVDGVLIRPHYELGDTAMRIVVC